MKKVTLVYADTGMKVVHRLCIVPRAGDFVELTSGSYVVKYVRHWVRSDRHEADPVCDVVIEKVLPDVTVPSPGVIEVPA